MLIIDGYAVGSAFLELADHHQRGVSLQLPDKGPSYGDFGTPHVDMRLESVGQQIVPIFSRVSHSSNSPAGLRRVFEFSEEESFSHIPEFDLAV